VAQRFFISKWIQATHTEGFITDAEVMFKGSSVTAIATNSSVGDHQVHDLVQPQSVYE
jgi:hypothetical protein